MNISFTGPVMDLSGYAVLNRSLLLELERLGVGINLVLTDALNYRCELDQDIQTRFQHMFNNKLPAIINIESMLAENFNYHPNFYNIGLTMLESDRLNQKWVVKCNQKNEVWVPSNFNYRTFSQSGVEQAKLHVFPLGIDTIHFHPGLPGLPGIETKGFTFLSNFELYPRKGYDILLEAYFQEFKNTQNVTLLLKIRSIFPSQIKDFERLVSNLRKRYAVSHLYPKIIILDNPLKPNELPNLYASANCFVLPTHGEGWNFPCCEAMACGLPVITTNWSAHLDYINSQNSYLIDINGLEKIQKYGICVDKVYEGGYWAKPNIHHLRQLMRFVYGHPEQAKQTGEKASRDIAAKFSIKAAGERIFARLLEIDSQMNN